MEEKTVKQKIIETTALAADYCYTLENARNMERDDFINAALGLLPRLYIAFNEVVPETVDLEPENEYFNSYVDEDYYESIRRNVESILGPDDTFLETFEDDMKYSDTPIASSISECLADIFQPLFNFVAIVRDTEGESISAAYTDCRENFMSYWGQTLCNVLRALNHLKYN